MPTAKIFCFPRDRDPDHLRHLSISTASVRHPAVKSSLIRSSLDFFEMLYMTALPPIQHKVESKFIIQDLDDGDLSCIVRVGLALHLVSAIYIHSRTVSTLQGAAIVIRRRV